jgi:hypothetical protein
MINQLINVVADGHCSTISRRFINNQRHPDTARLRAGLTE